MNLKPQLLDARVMHKRLIPKINTFQYRVYYMVLPLPYKNTGDLFGKFQPKDLGHRDGSDPTIWANNIIKKYGIKPEKHQLVLITMPQVLGYVFNPISFYFCLNQNKTLRAVIAEVHNTFGEQHTYFCSNPNEKTITPNSWLSAKKLFHVSPFLEIEGHYNFRFSISNKKIGIWINYYDAKNNMKLLTSLIGKLRPLEDSSFKKAFFRQPFITLKTIFLIHWQALKLFIHGNKLIFKPPQSKKRVSSTQKITKL